MPLPPPPPPHQLKQGHLEIITLDHVEMAFEDPQEWRYHNLSGIPVAVPGHPHGEKHSLMFRQNVLCFCANCLLSCHQTPLRKA